MNLSQITPLILTWNEAPNLGRCLERLRAFPKVVVVDSGSTDGTAELARGFANVEVWTRPFDDHTTQWNYGITLVESLWVLALDADYVLDEGFTQELAELMPGPETAAGYAGFRYWVQGRALRATLYPPRAVLFRKDRCRYREDGHTQLLEIQGETLTLKSRIDHDDRKPMSRWLQSQGRYASLEAAKLSAAGKGLGADGGAGLRMQDRLRQTVVLAPLATLVYCLFAKRLLLDGWPGWYYTLQRVLAEIMLSLYLLERKLPCPVEPEPEPDGGSKVPGSRETTRPPEPPDSPGPAA